MKLEKESVQVFLAAAGILFPVFFTLSGGIYLAQETVMDSGGVIATLPLPVSLLVCLGVIAWRAPQILDAKPAVIMMLGTLAVLGASLFLAGDGVTPITRKLVMIAQVVLPLIGLWVGMIIPQRSRDVGLAFLAVIVTLTPLQLWATWQQGHYVLTDDLYAFTIYSHIQYVPVIFVCAYAYLLFILWDRHPTLMSFLSGVMVLYVGKSNQYLAMGAFFLGLLCFLSYKAAARFRPGLVALAAVMLVGSVAITVGYVVKHPDRYPSMATIFAPAFNKFAPLLAGKIPPNLQERFGDWQLFGSRIIDTPRTLWVGRAEPMPREIRTSPHNWYLDIAHTFGLIGLLPIVLLMGYTVRLFWINRSDIPGEIRWLAAIVAFLVLIDSNFKVTLRQPYPGIFAFFLWGMLLQQLKTVNGAQWHQD